jgi:hypothetical protein
MQAPCPAPYLFFGPHDLPALRARSADPPFDECRALIKASAACLAAMPIPQQPDPGPLVARENGVFLDEFLQAHYAYLAAGQALQNCGQVLAFAYLLDGDEAMGARARQWVLALAGWSCWGPAADPFGYQAAPALAGTAVLYDWLAGVLNLDDRRRLQQAMSRQLEGTAGRWPPATTGAALGGNTAWSCMAAAGLASLALLEDDERAPAWAARWAGLFGRALPAAFAADGAYQEGVGWWDLCALRAGLPFMAALRRCGGPDLYESGGLRAYPSFLLGASRAFERDTGPQPRSWARFLPPSPLHYRHVLLHLAAAFGDRVLAGVAGPDLKVPEGTPLDWFFFYWQRVPYDAGRWYTVELSWDAVAGSFTMAVDGRTWSMDVGPDPDLDNIDGLCFSGEGLRLRHLGVRPGAQEAVALLEQETELTLGQGHEVSGALLEASQLRLRFAAAASGTVWFQACKTSDRQAAAAHLTADGKRGPGMRMEAVGLFPDLAADFRFADAEGRAWPPGAQPGGRVWFDGPWEYLWRQGMPPAAAVPPRSSTFFPHAGLAFLRHGPDADIELRLRAGPAWGRDRGDQNAFVLSIGGQPLAGEVPEAASGDSRPGRRQYELGNFYLNTFASNTLLVDGRPQEREGLEEQWGKAGDPSCNGHIESFFSAPAFDVAIGEAGGAYAGLKGFCRSIVFVKPDYFFIVDHIDADRERQIEWLLHTNGRLEVDGNRARLEGSEGAAEVFFLDPEGAGPECRWAPAQLENERTPYLCLPLKGQRVQIGTVLVPLAPGTTTEIQPERLSVRGGVAMRLRRGNGHDLLICRDPQGEGIGVDGVRSDGQLAFLRRDRDLPVYYALVGGTRLHWRTELVGLAQAGSVAVQRSSSRLRAWTGGEAGNTLRLHLGNRPRFVRLNGQRLEAGAWVYSPQGRRLSIEVPPGSHELDVALK